MAGIITFPAVSPTGSTSETSEFGNFSSGTSAAWSAWQQVISASSNATVAVAFGMSFSFPGANNGVTSAQLGIGAAGSEVVLATAGPVNGAISASYFCYVDIPRAIPSNTRFAVRAKSDGTSATTCHPSLSLTES